MGTGTSAKGLTGVDWYPSRMEGKTIMFQIWYIQVLRRLARSRIFDRDNDIYEAYDMNGKIVQGTDGWGNYTEHSGGYIWAIVEGLFGFNFDSDNKAVASINLNF